LPDERLGALEVDPALLAWSAGRDQAMSLPTAANCRNLICGTVAQLDVQRSRGGEILPKGALLTRPDPDATWPETLSETVDDLLWYGRAYWLVLAFDGQATAQLPHGYPVRARRLPAYSVQPQLSEDYAAYTRIESYVVGGARVDPAFILPFDAGHEGILRYGANALAAAYALEVAARRMADVELPAGVLENQGHEMSQADAEALVAGFQAARRSSGVAFLQGVKYSREALDPSDMQLVDARAMAATEICRLFSMPVQLAAASPSGNASAQLYANLTTTLAQLLTTAVGPYLRAIEAVLGSDQVCPRGQTVAFQAGQWLRADPASAADYAVGLLDAGIINTAEARGFLGLGPAPTAANLTPGVV
jgi:phage portal protein BeeE